MERNVVNVFGNDLSTGTWRDVHIVVSHGYRREIKGVASSLERPKALVIPSMIGTMDVHRETVQTQRKNEALILINTNLIKI